MAIAVAAGIAAGFIGFVPLMVALRMSRRVFSSSMLHVAAFGLGGFFVSLVVLAIELFACSRIAHDALLAFGLAEIATLIIVTSVYVVVNNRASGSGNTKER